MEKSVKTIGKGKFSKLPPRKQHRLLADLAKSALAGDKDGFLPRYDELQSWASLDRYTPPSWLSQAEALEEYLIFHSNFGSPIDELTGHDSGIPSISWQPRFPVEVVLDQIRSPYNVGSVLRITDNFGFKGLVHASPWMRLDHPQLRKAARGCENWIPVRFEPDLVRYLKEAACPVIGIENDHNAVPIDQWEAPGECVLIVGNETYGIASAIRRCCAQTVFVPMFGFKRSMNLHHALAVVAQKIVERNVTTPYSA